MQSHSRGSVCNLAVVVLLAGLAAAAIGAESPLVWQRLPDLPDELGVAGPFVGVHNDALIVAGGANFPRPVWETAKVWRDRIFVLVKSDRGYVWRDGGRLPRPMAYGAAVSTPQGVICLGGNDSRETFREVFALRWDPQTKRVTQAELPPLPRPCAYGQAAVLRNVIYLAGGQAGLGLESAMNNFWSLDLAAQEHLERFSWREREGWPGERRALNITAGLQQDSGDRIYVLSGRTQQGDDIRFLTDMWAFDPDRDRWERCADLPRCAMAGTGVPLDSSRLLILGGDDGSLFFQADELRDNHPGFPREALAYDTTTGAWSSAGLIPQNQVTTIAALWGRRIILASGEVRPRVRTPAVWSIVAREATQPHGFR